MSQQTVTINGVVYDAHSGLPVAKSTATPITPPQTKQPKPSHTLHHTSQKSHTLNRRIVKKADIVSKPAPAVARQPKPTKSPAITKFAPHPATITRPARTMDIGPISHPVGAKAVQRHQATIRPVAPAHHTTPAQHQAAAAPKPSQIIKQEAIAQALDTPTTKTTKKHHAPKASRKSPRMASVMTASFALLLLGGYFTYLNMPNLSTRVAAVQAGLDATYPGYHPDGYSANGPVAYDNGWVEMKFAANGGPQSYTVKQEKKNWDSSALLANYVEPTSDGAYVPHTDRGLTIYTFNNNAAWMNNGILYTINGDAPLSSEQILQIASSM